MIAIGLTGSIGMGKTAAADMLRAMKIPVHCSDAAVHGFLRQGGAGEYPVLMEFPEAWDKKRKQIGRSRLRAVLGYDHEAWDRLEDILHPLVRESQAEFLKVQRSMGVRLAALDIPLLFETGAENKLDYTICVSAPPFVQRCRVMARPGMTEEDLQFRLSRQMPDAEKCRRADFIVHSGLGLAYTREELENIVRQMA